MISYEGSRITWECLDQRLESVRWSVTKFKEFERPSRAMRHEWCFVRKEGDKSEWRRSKTVRITRGAELKVRARKGEKQSKQQGIYIPSAKRVAWEFRVAPWSRDYGLLRQYW